MTRARRSTKGRARRPVAASEPAAVLLRAKSFRWRGVRREAYKALAGDWAGIARYVLFAGSRGAPMAFDVRYFEIERGGRSTFELHRHAHVVIGLRGVGKIRIGARWRRLELLDSCYIGPRTAHQLGNDRSEPFGFLCIVDARRDRGKPVTPTRRSRSGA